MALDTSIDGRRIIVSEKRMSVVFVFLAAILVALGLIFVFLRVYEAPVDFIIGGIFLIIGAFVFVVGLGSKGKLNTWILDMDQRAFFTEFEENSESYSFDSIESATAGRDEGPAAVLNMKDGGDKIVVVGFEDRYDDEVELLVATINTALGVAFDRANLRPATAAWLAEIETAREDGVA